MDITGKTRITGLFGYPVKHTLSPAMHNAAFKALKLNCVYLPFEIHPKKLDDALKSIRTLSFLGINITVPHKEKVLHYLDKIDPLAKKIGSVNTIVNRNGKLIGYNTDGKGFLQDLKDNGINPKGKTALLVGAGGASRAIAATLAFSGIKKIYITDIDEKQSRKLANKIRVAQFESFNDFHKCKSNYKIDILINVTPIGMHKDDISPIPFAFIDKYKPKFVYDVIYNIETKLIRYTKKKKIDSSGGLGMLLNQGALAFELWTHKKAPRNLMRKTLLKAIK